ncbi:hypothetical protein ACKWTF_013961 [Chironomus riparius]
MIEVLEYLLIDDEDYLYLGSIEYFTKDACNEPQLQVLNSFNKVTQKWTKKLQNYEKFQDFHGCELVMLAGYNPYDGSAWIHLEINKNLITPVGLIPELFELLATPFNYKPGYKFIIQENVTAFYCTRKYYEHMANKTQKKPNVCFGLTRFEIQIYMQFQFTTTFMDVHDVVVVTPGPLYTSYEKLLLPFDVMTWILLTSTFLAAFVTIFVIYMLPKSIQNIFYGANVKIPALNVLSTFFGIQQHQVPKQDFPRFILMNFILFCLIFRTCYQSKMFEFMTSTPRRPPPNSMKEMAQKDYKLFAVNNFINYTNLMTYGDDNWPKLELISRRKFYYIYHKASQNSSAKLGLLMESHMNLFNEITKRKLLKWHQLPDSFFVSRAGFIFYHNNFYLQVIDRAINAWIPMGIMDKVMERYLGVHRKFTVIKQPMVLTLDNLKFGFTIWLGCCGICSAFFLLELVFYGIKLKFSKKEKKLRKIKFAKVHSIEVASIQQFELKEGIKHCELFRKSKRLSVEDPMNRSDNLKLLNVEKNIKELEDIRIAQQLQQDEFDLFGEKVYYV